MRHVAFCSPGGRPAGRWGFLTMLLLAQVLLGSEMPSATQLLEANRPLVIGHRGYNVLAPENTLPAFRFALAAGADLVELDYHHTKDDVPIVIHDRELDRTTDAVAKWGAKQITVETKTAAELQTLDAGTWFASHYAGTRLPLLSEALEVIQHDGVTLIERKGGDAATCVRLLRDRNFVNRVVVQSFDWSYLRDFHTLAPDQVLGALGPPGSRDGRKLTDQEKTLSRPWIDEAKQTGARVIGWSKLVTRPAADYAHAQGLKLWVYTINDPVLAGELLDLGVDGIITDNPSLIWRAMALRQRSAKPRRRMGRRNVAG